MEPALKIGYLHDNSEAKAFCVNFVSSQKPKYILGRNEYAKSIARVVDVDGFIDDFTDEPRYLDKPVITSKAIPDNALVVSVVIGKPFVAEKRLKSTGVKFLDYFAFSKHANINVLPVKFWESFRKDFALNKDRYDWIYSLLHDEESKITLTKVINFRLYSNLEYMRGFVDSQHRQYFESFLDLKVEGETFVDVGCYDGYTSEYFIKQCPNYTGIHVFEPSPENMETVKSKLSRYSNIHYYQHGLSNRSQILRFESHGSTSRISDDGHIQISVKPLDGVLQETFTFLKMDIEGAEVPAIEGSQIAIKKHHPRLAISVYHRFDDLWRIPEMILSYRDDYQIYLRHYTEGVDETVMFFVPI